MHDRGRVATSALPDLESASRLAGTARTRIGSQGRRTARPSPRGRRTPQNQPQAPPGLGRPSSVRRPHLTSARSAAQSPLITPATVLRWHQRLVTKKVDLPEPVRSPTPRPDHRRAHRADGPRERDPGLQAHPRRTPQTRPPHRRVYHPQDPQAAADSTSAAASNRHELKSLPASTSLNHVGRGLLPRRLRHHSQANLRLLRPGSRLPLRAHPRNDQPSDRSLDDPAGPQPADGPRRPGRHLPIPHPRPRRPVHLIVRRGPGQRRHRHREDPTAMSQSKLLCRPLTSAQPKPNSPTAS